MRKIEFTLLFIVVFAIIFLGFFWGGWRQVEAPSYEVEDKIDITDWEIYNPYPNEIKITEPAVGAVIPNPLSVKGEARGSWYFEATFPIILVNWDGLIIAEGYATADGEWMTEEFVPFTGELEYVKPEYSGEWTRRGAVILKNANASGLPENDRAVEIPILFQ